MLARIILRSLVCNALTRQDSDNDDVTMAGEKIFDSRLDPHQFTIDDKPLPAIVVYTDEDERTLLNKSSNNGPMMRHIDVRLELAITSFAEVSDDGRRGIAQVLPTTDAELEAKLDLFEQQVHWALVHSFFRPASAALQAFVVGWLEIESSPHRDESGNNRAAVRRLRYRCRINDDCPPLARTGAPSPRRRLTEDDFPVAPWLKKPLVVMQDMPSMRNVISALGGDDSRAAILPLFKRMGVGVDCVQPITDPVILAKLKRTKGPDGKLDVRCFWEM